MKVRYYLSVLLGAGLLAACSSDETSVAFGIDQNSIEIGADGGTRTINISASETWIAMTDDPWISVSPANGRGSTSCEIRIDSALTTSVRRGVVRIQTEQEDMQIAIEQQGYDYTVELNETQITVPNYAAYGERHFDVKVRTNAEFSIDIPSDAGWLTCETPKFNFDRGVRPREVTVRFNWKVSSQPERLAEVHFTPKSVEAVRQDDLTVTQEAAPKIEEDTRAGDSVALLGIARALDTWASWESAEPMSNWDSVELWEEGMEGYTPEKAGRVKSADFFLFETHEGLPYEVQYLTAAEELKFRSNVNSFLYELDPGEYITKLAERKNLKRLTLMGYGLTTLNEDFKFESLEYLDLSANNFENFPAVLRKENFPNLKTLILNANQVTLVYDLSNYTRSGLGGFYAATTPTSAFPRWLLEWEDLEQLLLSVNYLQGYWPTLEDDATWTSFYTEADVAAANAIQADSLPSGTFPKGIVGLPKVWPKMTRLAINYNRMTGVLPNWLLYHPALDWWMPWPFVFTQEGKDETGRNAGFSNEPASTMDYYYKFYPKKKNPYSESDDSDNANTTKR